MNRRAVNFSFTHSIIQKYGNPSESEMEIVANDKNNQNKINYESTLQHLGSFLRNFY